VALARNAFRVVAWLFLVALVVQFFLGGLGTLGGESIDPHRLLGATALTLTPIAMLLLAVAGHLGRVVIAMTAVLVAFVILETVVVQVDVSWLKALHVPNALIVFAVAQALAMRAGRGV